MRPVEYQLVNVCWQDQYVAFYNNPYRVPYLTKLHMHVEGLRLLPVVSPTSNLSTGPVEPNIENNTAKGHRHPIYLNSLIFSKWMCHKQSLWDTQSPRSTNRSGGPTIKPKELNTITVIYSSWFKPKVLINSLYN